MIMKFIISLFLIMSLMICLGSSVAIATYPFVDQRHHDHHHDHHKHHKHHRHHHRHKKHDSGVTTTEPVVAVWEKFKDYYNDADAESISKLFADCSVCSPGMLYGYPLGSFTKWSGSRSSYLRAFQQTFEPLSSALMGYTQYATAKNGTVGLVRYKFLFNRKNPYHQHVADSQTGTIFIAVNSENKITQYIDYGSALKYTQQNDADMIKFAKEFLHQVFDTRSTSFVNQSVASDFNLGMYVNEEYQFQNRQIYLNNLESFMHDLDVDSKPMHYIDDIYTSYDYVVMTLNVAVVTSKGLSITSQQMLQMKLTKNAKSPVNANYQIVMLNGFAELNEQEVSPPPEPEPSSEFPPMPSSEIPPIPSSHHGNSGSSGSSSTDIPSGLPPSPYCTGGLKCNPYYFPMCHTCPICKKMPSLCGMSSGSGASP